MLTHYLTQIFRNFRRFKSTFLINWIGLSTGLACSLLIYLWVSDELDVDKFNAHDDRLYSAMEHRIRDGGIWTSSTTSGLLAEALAADMPEVEYTVPYSYQMTFTLTHKEVTLKSPGRFAGKDFFRIFSYGLLEGDEATVLSARKSIAVSKRLAIKLFGRWEGATGKEVQFNHDKIFFISGVFNDMPANATDQFEFVGTWDDFRDGKESLTQWTNTGPRTFVLLRAGTDVNQFNKKIINYIKVKTAFNVTHRTLFVKKYSDNYLYGKYENGKVTGGRIEYVRLFSIIAVFVLVIACINFMNLSTAKASRRIKEVGIKKALGAGRGRLIVQYFGEAMAMTLISMLTAVVLVMAALPHFNQITGKALEFQPDQTLLLTLLGVAVVTGLVSGSYPALYLSGFAPGAVLKGKLSASFGEVWARKGLVVFQFVLSIVFIVGVIVVYEQIKFVQSTSLGYEKEHIIYFPREGTTNEVRGLETALSEMRNIPGVVNASSIGHNLRGHNSGTYGVEWPGKDPNDKTEFENLMVNLGMMETLGLKMKEGRTFLQGSVADTAKLIFNEAGIKFMGLTDPVGKTVKLWGEDREIIGVVKDFNFESLHTNVKPLFIQLAAGGNYLIMVKLSAAEEKETIVRLREFYKKINPGFGFDYKFLDEEYQTLYAAEQRVATLSRYFAILAILISCLGLFGLAAFTAERRLKEIGIRKVLGSGIFGIVYLLSAEFTKIVGVAVVIALPLSYWATKEWLSSFAFRVPLSWWYFVGAAVAALLISWLTVGIQALKAARVNPVECLKDE